MNILMLCEYFYPYDHGGSEWSVYYLAKGLIKEGHRVTILTPNYGTKSEELIDGIYVKRFWFPKKIKKNKPQSVTPYWHTNVLWIITTCYVLLKSIQTKKFNIVHVQGKFFLPSAAFVRLFSAIPIVCTIRDYQILCPYGFCITSHNQYKKCSMKEFVSKEISEYLWQYAHGKPQIVRLLIGLAGIRLKLYADFLRFCLRRLNGVISISDKVTMILAKNGIKSKRIYNSVEPAKSLSKNNWIVFVGRLTWGKGAHLIVPSIASVLKFSKLKCYIVGNGLLKNLIKRQIQENQLEQYVFLKGQMSHAEAVRLVAQSKVLIAPALWEEPFGRTALEAINVGTPVIVSDRGGLPEIITHWKNGFVVDPTEHNIRKTLKKIVEEYPKVYESTKKLIPEVRKKFGTEVLAAHVSFYESRIN